VHLPLEVSLRGLGEVDSTNHDVDRFGKGEDSPMPNSLIFFVAVPVDREVKVSDGFLICIVICLVARPLCTGIKDIIILRSVHIQCSKSLQREKKQL